MVAIIPKTAVEIYSRKVDDDEDVLYVRAKGSRNYVRIHRHKSTGKLYNQYSDVVSEERFTSKLKKGTKKITAAEWSSIKQAAKKR